MGPFPHIRENLLPLVDPGGAIPWSLFAASCPRRGGARERQSAAALRGSRSLEDGAGQILGLELHSPRAVVLKFLPGRASGGMVDALASGASARKGVEVQLLSRARIGPSSR